ncbi:MAG TPA: adenosine deaminase [Ktedonosporobacter sp.]|nr:adenosine deaminase [Ktedonosporobacter sp.]
MDFKAYPKVELHLHLDCSLSYKVVRRIMPSITIEYYRQDFIAPARCTNLADFLARVPQAIALMQNEEQLRLVVFDLFEQLQQDTLLYAEIRFAPLLHTQAGLSPERVVEVVEAATSQACASTGIEARLILCTLRHFSSNESLQTAHLVERFQGSRVAALDLAGDEAGFPIAAHIPAYRYAAESNLARTAHAGEASGPQSVWETLRCLHPSRLGHGVRSIEDPALIDYLRQERIHLEVCPTSNLQTNIYAILADHPIDRLYELGISVSVNTDGRTLTNTNLAQEYERLHRCFSWEKHHFLNCNLEALRASFLPESARQRLAAHLQERYQSV